MPELFASVAQLEERLGSPVADHAQAIALLRYATARLRARLVADLDDEVPDLVQVICVEMVYRALTNPLGATQNVAGPFSTSFGPDAPQRIYLNAQETADLRAAGLISSGLAAIATTRGPVETPTPCMGLDEAR